VDGDRNRPGERSATGNQRRIVVAVTERKRTRAQIEQVMRRIGLSDRIEEAHRVLPEVVDLDRDALLLLGLGLSIDRIADELGAGPW
jgi:hypothetical protein